MARGAHEAERLIEPRKPHLDSAGRVARPSLAVDPSAKPPWGQCLF
jgi:hypothetical protein